MKTLENFEKLVSYKQSNFLSVFQNYKNKNQMKNTNILDVGKGLIIKDSSIVYPKI
jgi:hypothetical protein